MRVPTADVRHVSFGSHYAVRLTVNKYLGNRAGLAYSCESRGSKNVEFNGGILGNRDGKAKGLTVR